MKVALFYLICMAVTLNLLWMAKLRNFYKVTTNRIYENKGGQRVHIVDMQRVIDDFIFIDSTGKRYFEDGDCVGEITRSSQFHLHRLIG